MHMEWKQIEDRYLIRLDVGDEVIASVQGFAAELGIGSGMVSGIGGIENVVLGYYDLDARSYLKKELEGRYEMLNLAGNLSLVDKERFFHAHAIVSGPDMATLGGHLFQATVAVTAELYLWGSTVSVSRSLDDGVGLNTLDL